MTRKRSTFTQELKLEAAALVLDEFRAELIFG